jgi:maltose alpha-D-glucosyltransferase / alpha-amylase
MTLRSSGKGSREDATWYKDAIIYEARVRSFFDSNDDGAGDLRGLTSKLGYLQDLGVTAIWLLPFYPSPGRDDGYDISDYTSIHPEVGTLADFEELVAEAHRRGLRIITELVLNHTSDQHPWFQRARRAPPGSPERDFYVWGDSPDRYRDARIIFRDFEASNWTWDREAGAYYWHRFYAHQPDVNFENPAVQEALLGVVDFWLGKGVDGLRLDAVPYLYEEDGTNCENLPKTHAFLKRLRAHIDARFPNRMLLAEANQWPEDAAAYFGDGDECHMNFHFPLMPRMFMAIHQEDRFPIVDIFAQTPAVHPSCQWALFLRNHDELTLEMVTDEERDYMYRAYADQAAMRINLGIRRRLAPLVGNSRRKIELLDGLLFSLPGTPVLYYGDEIGMGDNVYLGDRNGVRTPMQWSMDRNAGFSRANPQQLILPVVLDPQYHYESLNVENQQQNPSSLLWWTKRLIALRKRFSAFGRGSIEFLAPTNARILAFLREHDDEIVLVVANLSRFTQYTELDLSKHKGTSPVELFGQTRFPAIGDSPYPLTLGPHGFYWFELERPRATGDRPSLAPRPAAVECTSVEALLLGDERPLLADALAIFLEGRSWYRGRGHALRSAQIASAFRVVGQPVFFAVVRAEYLDAEPELYSVPMAWMVGEPRGPAGSVVAFVQLASQAGEGARGALVDAMEDPVSARVVLGAVAGREHIDGPMVPSVVGRATLPDSDPTVEPRKLGREREHSTLRFGDQVVLKLARRLEEGHSPEVEMGTLLATYGPGIAPPLLAYLEHRPPHADPVTVAVLHGFVPNVGTAWDLALTELGRYYERVLARGPGAAAPAPLSGSPLLVAGRRPPPEVAAMIGGHLETVTRLGARLAELHLAVIASPRDPVFAPESYSSLDRRSKYQSLRNLSGRVLRTLRERLSSLPASAQSEARAVLSREKDMVTSLEPLLRTRMTSARIRVHGNLHLGHALATGKDFVLTDLNTFRALPLAERRRKRSPLRDLAWMAQSFELAAFKVLHDPASVRESDVEAARPWAVHWTSWTCASLLGTYIEATASSPLLAVDREASVVLFEAFRFERVLYQLEAALEEGSATVTIPLLEIARMM